ncbi:MAG TPA: heavy metal-binding domain-containing protein, partial [Steroidobacteraceae bacterium]
MTTEHKHSHRHAAPSVSHARNPDSGTKPAEGTIYTCPMHPEIRQVGPGSCP